MTVAMLPLTRDFSSSDNLDFQQTKMSPNIFQKSRQWLLGETLRNNIKSFDLTSSSPIIYFQASLPLEAEEVLSHFYQSTKEQVFDFSIYTSVPKNKSTIFLEVRNVGKVKTRYSFDEEI